MSVRRQAETKRHDALGGIVMGVVPCHGDKHVVESGAGPDLEGKIGCAWDDALSEGKRRTDGVRLGGWREPRDLQRGCQAPFLDSDEETASGRHLVKEC